MRGSSCVRGPGSPSALLTQLLSGDPRMAEAETSTRPKQRGGRIVPSRYLEYERKTSGKSAPNTSLSAIKGPGKVASPKRPSVQFRKCKGLAETTSGRLQSTLLDSHGNFRPDLEVSVIKGLPDKSRHRTPVLKLSTEGSSRRKTVVPSDTDDLIGMLDSEMLLLTFASVKMEKNLALLEEKAERNLLTLSEEVEKLQKEVHKKQRGLQHLKKERELSEALDRQLEALGPASEHCARFREEYRHFATAVDSTRHELPVKEIYMDENKGQYLADLQKVLAETQRLLNEALRPHSRENAGALTVLRELEEASLKLDAELPRSLAQVLDLSADVSKEAALHYQKVCEDSLGLETVKRLYFS